MVEAVIGEGTLVPEVVGKASTDRFLALISDLYLQVQALQQRVAELEEEKKGNE